MASKSLWNEESVYILLREYKKQKDSLAIRRSSHMPKKGWESIKKKLHIAGYSDIRLQHVIKKFSTLKLHYKEFREGLPVKQRIYGFVNLLSEILDDDPYIAFAKPTKRMKEKIMFEKKYLKTLSQTENHITVEYVDLDDNTTVEIRNYEPDSINDDMTVNSSQVFVDQNSLKLDSNQTTNRKRNIETRDAKHKRKPLNENFDKPNMPSWISYLVDLLKKEEQQRSDQLWKLHENICRTEKIKVDLMERLINSFSSSSNNEIVLQQTVENSATELVLPESSVVVSDNKSQIPRNIIVVDDEGSIYLKPTHLLKRKGERIEYAVAHKIFKPDSDVQFENLDGESIIEAESVIDAPQLHLQLIGDSEEIIIENCDESEIYNVEPAYEEEVVEIEGGMESNVISHVEIIEETEDCIKEPKIETIEYIEQITE